MPLREIHWRRQIGDVRLTAFKVAEAQGEHVAQKITAHVLGFQRDVFKRACAEREVQGHMTSQGALSWRCVFKRVLQPQLQGAYSPQPQPPQPSPPPGSPDPSGADCRPASWQTGRAHSYVTQRACVCATPRVTGGHCVVLSEGMTPSGFGKFYF